MLRVLFTLTRCWEWLSVRSNCGACRLNSVCKDRAGAWLFIESHRDAQGRSLALRFSLGGKNSVADAF